MTRTRWIIFALICIAVLGALVFFSTRNRVDVSNIDANAVYNGEGIADHVIGDRESDVVFIEYGDFQCPSCQSLSSSLKTVVDNYKDNIAFVYRNFPLTNIHPNALAAATAAEAAGLQGKFFEMHDLLFQNQNTWKDADANGRTETFRGYAEQLGLNIDEFNTALTDPQVSEKIRRDQALAREIGATGTPTLVLNGEVLDNSTWSNGTAELERLLRAAIKESGQNKLPDPVNAIEEEE